MIRDKPDVPPSAVSAAPVEKETFCEAFRVLWANKNFVLLSVCNGLNYATQHSVTSILSNLFNPFGYTMSQLSMFVASNLFAGVLCAFLVGILLDKTGWYRRTHLSLSFLGMLTVPSIFIALTQDLTVFPSAIVLGMVCISYHPMSFSYGAEMTFPT